jgi:hypothetical protein
MVLLRGLAILLTMAGIAGCGDASVMTSPDVTVAASEGGGTAAYQPATSVQETAAKIGDPIVIRGSKDGSRMKVTVLQVRDPAPAQQYLGPFRGKRLVAVELRLENVGTVVYDEFPSNGGGLVDQAHGSFAAAFKESALSPELSSDLCMIAPNGRLVGWITFEIPKHATLRKFQFVLDSGFGPESGDWNL